MTSEDLAELDAFIQKLPLTEQKQKQTDMLFAHDATTKEFYIALGSYKNKNRRKVTPQLSRMQQDKAIDILKRLYAKVSKREGKVAPDAWSLENRREAVLFMFVCMDTIRRKRLSLGRAVARRATERGCTYAYILFC